MIFSHFELLKKKRIIQVIIFVYIAKIILVGTNLQLYFYEFFKRALKNPRGRNSFYKLGSKYQRIFVGFFLGYKEPFRFYKCLR